MNFKILLLLFIVELICDKRFGEASGKVEQYSDAIDSIISEFLVNIYEKFNIIKVNNRSVNMITENIVKRSCCRYSYRLEDYNSSALSKNISRKRFILIIILDSLKTLKEFSEHLNTTKISRNGFFLVVLINATSKDYREIFQIFWSKKFYNVGILEHATNNLRLWTFMPFSDGACETVTPKLINVFDTTSKTWSSNVFFPKKFKNLHNCKLIHETTRNTVIEMPSGEFIGKEIVLLNEIGKTLNFTIEHIVAKLFGSGYKSGCLKNVLDGKTHMTAGSLLLERVQMFTESLPFLSDPLAMIIPPGAPFSPMEKLLKTFDEIVWMSILFLFIFAILIVKLVPKKIKYFLIGRKNDHVILNMILVFLGGTLATIKLPNQNFTRCLMLVFSFYALTLRTAYVGILFQFLRSEIKHKELTLVDEMIENDFTFYAFESMFLRLSDFKFFNRFASKINQNLTNINELLSEPKSQLIISKTVYLHWILISKAQFSRSLVRPCFGTR